MLPNLDSEAAWRALLYSFGGSVQNADNRPVLKSSATLTALKFGKALFEQAMTHEALAWDIYQNNRAMLAGDISLTLNSNSIIRFGEKKQLPLVDDIWLAAAPQGPAGRLAPVNWINVFMIWNFGKSIETAKQFAVDFVAQSRHLMLKSDLDVLPTFPGTVPDYTRLIAHRPSAKPADKYRLLADVYDWTVNYDYPGTSNPAVAEIFYAGLIPSMFTAVATGKMTAGEAMIQVDQEVRKVFDKWQALGKI